MIFACILKIWISSGKRLVLSKEPTVFEISDLSLKLGGKYLLHHFNFKFTGPGFVFIEGDNGTGKSSFLKACAGFIVPDSGKIYFKNIKENSFSFLTTTSLGLLPELTGRDHIRLVGNSRSLDEKMIELKISEFSEIDLFSEILSKKVSDLSQGMKQFLRLFLHLLIDEEVLFLDEPFLYLSPRLKNFYQKKLEELSQNCLIFVTDQSFDWSPERLVEKIILGSR